MTTIQYTMYSTTGKYRPISTLIQVPSMEDYEANKSEWNKRAIKRILAKRYVGPAWLKENGYTTYRVREYDKKKIEQENAERYERIKKERGWA